MGIEKRDDNISFRCPKSLKEELKAQAIVEKRKFSDYLNIVLGELVERLKKSREL